MKYPPLLVQDLTNVDKIVVTQNWNHSPTFINDFFVPRWRKIVRDYIDFDSVVTNTKYEVQTAFDSLMTALFMLKNPPLTKKTPIKLVHKMITLKGNALGQYHFSKAYDHVYDSSLEEVSLIVKNFNEFDLIRIKEHNEYKLFLGHWNDGIL